MTLLLLLSPHGRSSPAAPPAVALTVEDLPWMLRPFRSPAEVAAFAAVFAAAWNAAHAIYPESPQVAAVLAVLVALASRPTGP